VQFVRVLGTATQQVADAAVSAFVVNVGPSKVRADPSGLELARANAESSTMLGALVDAFDVVLRHNLETQRRPISADVNSGVELQHRSIGFVDIVGSTQLAEQLDVRELSAALTTFETTVSDVVTARGARVVKMIGDEVMFAAAEPEVACDISLTLVDTFARHDVLPPVHGAVATGDVVARAGDYSGTVVHLAARAAKLAGASTILVDRTTADELPSSFVVDHAQTHKLKGFGAPVELARVSRAG
jgi:adenylate cyclase